jgi:chromosome segregation ATPase
MAIDNMQSHEEDLERTDRLPILPGTLFDPDVEDDAVRMDTLAMPQPTVVSTAATADFPRTFSVDLPSLADSVRSVEERIARQHADYEALSRSYEKAREAEAAALARGNELSGSLAAVRTSLETEQSRARELDRVLAEKTAAAEAARSRTEELARDVERLQHESRSLRESLAARDATIVQVLHSLGERDEQLHALQREHVQLLPVLETRAKAGAQLEANLSAERNRSEVLARELKESRASLAALKAQVASAGTELDATRAEMSITKQQAASHLELLRTREWRRGFNENMFRESDSQAAAEQLDHAALSAERDRLKQQVADTNAKLAAHEESIEVLKSTVAAHTAARAKQEDEMRQAERSRAELTEQIAVLTAERARLGAELSARDAQVATVLAAQAAADKAHAETAARIVGLQSEAAAREQEMSVLVAHLNEARRPIQLIEADVKRLTEESAAKSATLAQLTEENRSLRAAVERTRGALEEREFLIRRLERSESNNANVLGRIQTSMERLGSTGAVVSAPPAECSAELIRIDGQKNTSHPLAKRTRIGRAPGCELQIDSSSVSRHHALVLVGAREVVIEDLNSTNGVLVNGRKVSRLALNDGDLLTIGEVQFRLSLHVAPRLLEAPAPPV